MADKLLEISSIEQLKIQLGEDLEIITGGLEPVVLITPAKLHTCLQLLKDDPNYAMAFLRNLTAAEYPEYYEVVYHLYSFTLKHNVTVKTRCSKASPRVPSIIKLWPYADYQEREVYDLLGVTFTGHPNLTRILLPDDFDGHPLRKDFKLPSGEK